MRSCISSTAAAERTHATNPIEKGHENHGEIPRTRDFFNSLLANHVLFKHWQLAMMPARTRLLLLGLTALAVWAAFWALLGFDFWYVGATCLFFALLVAWRVDVTTREIPRRRAEDEKNRPRRDDAPWRSIRAKAGPIVGKA
jgi:hypothetical protein